MNTFDIFFDKKKYEIERQSSFIDKSFDYFKGLNLDHGTYFIVNPYISPNSIAQIFIVSIFRIDENGFSWFYRNHHLFNENMQRAMESLVEDLREDDYIQLQIFNMHDKWEELVRYLQINDEHIIQYNHRALLQIIVFLDQYEGNIIFKIFKAALYFILDECDLAKLEIQTIKTIAARTKFNSYTEYFEKLESYIFNKAHSLDRSNILFGIVSETDESYARASQKEKLYLDGILGTVREITNWEVARITGEKEDILKAISEQNWNIIAFYGHGNQVDGYRINPSLDPLVYSYISAQDLQFALTNSPIDRLLLFDFVCAKNHFSSYSAYPIPITVFSNGKHESGTFNNPSAYYYSIGFFKKYLKSDELGHCHELGLITLAMFGYDYLDSYDFVTYS